MNDVLEQFFRDEYLTLTKRMNARVRNMPDAEDIVMESFRRALSYWDSFNPAVKPLGAWFNTIMNNALKDFKRENFSPDLEFDEDLQEPIPNTLEEKDLAEHITREISLCKGDEKDILWLFFVKGYRYKSIQVVIESNHNRIKNTINKFRKNMGEKYGESLCS